VAHPRWARRVPRLSPPYGLPLIPAKARIQNAARKNWIPAYAGMSGICCTVIPPLTDSLFKQPSQGSAARILCRGPGQARLGLAPLPFSQRGMERRAAQPSVQRLAALPRLARARIATRRSIAAFLSPAPCFRGAQRRQTSLRPGWLPPPVVTPSSSHRRQPVLVPADDWPRPPGPAVTSRSGGRRILLRLQDRL